MLSDGAVSWTVELQTKVYIKVPTTALTLKTSWTQFHIYSFLALCLNRILNVKVIVAAFKQEKALEAPSPWLQTSVVDLRLKLYWTVQ